MMRRLPRRLRGAAVSALLAPTRAPTGLRLLHDLPSASTPLSVREALAIVQQRLTRRPNENLQASARTDAKVLIANALRPRLAHSNDVIFHLDRQLTAEEAAALKDATARRCRGEPLAYVLGRKEFWSMEFIVSSDTLIPRADSEVLIETLVGMYPKRARLSILDVGTGSGCLLLSALVEFPNATGVGIDVSPGALRVASENASCHSLADRTKFLRRDLAGLAHGKPQADGESCLMERFDVVLSNPPYIPRRELDLVAPDVLKYEPHLALFSDPEAVAQQLQTQQRTVLHDGSDEDDGLRMYRLLRQAIPSLLKPRPSDVQNSSELPRSVLVEVGSEAQANEVRALFTSKAPTSAMQFETAELLLDGRSRHRGVLFQTRA